MDSPLWGVEICPIQLPWPMATIACTSLHCTVPGYCRPIGLQYPGTVQCKLVQAIVAIGQGNWIGQISTPHSGESIRPILMKFETYTVHRPPTMTNGILSDEVGGVDEYPVCHCKATCLVTFTRRAADIWASTVSYMFCCCFLFFNDFRQTNYFNRYRTDLRQIFRYAIELWL